MALGILAVLMPIKINEIVLSGVFLYRNRPVI